MPRLREAEESLAGLDADDERRAAVNTARDEYLDGAWRQYMVHQINCAEYTDDVGEFVKVEWNVILHEWQRHQMLCMSQVWICVCRVVLCVQDIFVYNWV